MNELMAMGIDLACIWEEGHRVVALDSQGANRHGRILSMSARSRGSSRGSRDPSRRPPTRLCGPRDIAGHRERRGRLQGGKGGVSRKSDNTA